MLSELAKLDRLVTSILAAWVCSHAVAAAGTDPCGQYFGVSVSCGDLRSEPRSN